MRLSAYSLIEDNRIEISIFLNEKKELCVRSAGQIKPVRFFDDLSLEGLKFLASEFYRNYIKLNYPKLENFKCRFLWENGEEVELFSETYDVNLTIV